MEADPELKIHRYYRFVFPAFTAAVLFWILSGCLGPVKPASMVDAPTVTTDPNASPTLTPFQPLEDLPLPSPIPPTTPTPLPTLPPTPTATSTPYPTPVPVSPLYTLKVLADYAAHSLTVDETITYENSSEKTLSSLVLAVEPNRWKGCFVLGFLEVNGLSSTGYTLKGIRLEIPLSVALAPTQTVTLTFHYLLRLPKADSYHLFGYNSRQIDLVDWYPYVVPYDSGTGWLLHQPAEVGEHLVYDQYDFDVTLQFTDPGLPVTVAASAPAEQTSQGWHYRLDRGRNFSFSFSTSYISSSTTVGSVTVTSYYFGGERNAGEAILQQVAKALTTFAGYFGAFSHPSLSIVEAIYFDGIESDGLFFLSRDFYVNYDGAPLNHLVDIGVHETAHQWWFGLVGSDQAEEPWLDEALATYSELIFYEADYPGVTSWWNFRVEDFRPTGWVDTPIYDGGGFRPYANAVYLRGAQFLETLRGRMGEAAFFSFLKDYAVRMSGKRATGDDFFRILRQHTGADISDIVKAYFKNQH